MTTRNDFLQLLAQPTWAEIQAARNRREDEPIARRYAPYASLGYGHNRPDLCRAYREETW
jgi:hypothetical protein